jgi:two-component sensor histidine kinase/ligand-binding sensor domain-containing protein
MRSCHNRNAIFAYFFAMLLSCTCSSAVSAQGLQNKDFIITKRFFSVEEGLPFREVSSAIKDKDGFMWFGTHNGLSRFDGNTFKTYSPQDGLLGSYILSVCMDDSNRLFIVYNSNDPLLRDGCKIQVFDLNTYRFMSLESIFPALPFRASQVEYFANDEKGKLYFLISQPNQLWEYTSKKGFSLRIDFDKGRHVQQEPAHSMQGFSNFDVVQNGCLGISYRDEKYFVFPDTAMYLSDLGSEDALVSITNNHQLIIKKKGSPGFTAINRMGKAIAAEGIFIKDPPSTPLRGYWAIKGETGGGILMTIDENRIMVYQNGQSVEVEFQNGSENFFEINTGSNYFDKQGNLWICTTRGVWQIIISAKKFRSHFTNAHFPFITNNRVRGIYTDIDRTDADGKNNTLYAEMSNELVTERNGKLWKTRSEYAATLFSLIRHRDFFYVGGYQLYVYDPQSSKLVSKSQFPFGELWSLLEFSDSVILVGAASNIYVYDEKSGKCSPSKIKPGQFPTPMNVYRFLHTAHRGLVAVAENGIYLLNSKAEVVDYYGAKAQAPSRQLPFSDIYDMSEDSQGMAWFALNGGGLVRWNWNVADATAARNFTRFRIAQGMPSDILYRIEQDDYNNLWISSYKGLVRFNTRDFSTRIFGKKSGLCNDEYNRVSSFKAKDGGMYFGGVNGLDAFYPSDFEGEKTDISIPFRLVGLNKFSAKKDLLVDGMQVFINQGKTDLEVGDKFLSVEFSLLDYDNRIHRYAYKIEGVDKDWIYQNTNVIRISSLPYGDFKLRIKAQLESGQWNAEQIVLPIKVHRPFYMQPLFFVGSFMAFVALLIGFFSARSRKLQGDKEKLSSLVKQRTHSLSEALSDKEILLKEIHHRVKNNLQVVSGLMQLQKDELTDLQALRAINEGQSRVSSIALIHQNLYQNDDLGSVFFNAFLRDLHRQMEGLFENENRKLTLHLHMSDTLLDIDTAVPLGLILNELLTNTYKYAFSASQDLAVNIFLKENESGHYTLTYQDNGQGIAGGVDFENSLTLGMKLIGGLAKQLSGFAEHVFDGKSTFIIHFKITSLRKME